MPIDPNIALGVKPLQLADPLAQYGKIAAIQNAQTQNQLAQYQISSARRADEQAEARLNALREAGDDPASITNALIRVGDVKGAAEYGKMFREGRKADADLLDTKLKTARQFLAGINPADPNAPQQYLQWHMANHADPVIGPALAARGITAEQSMQKIQAALQTPGGFRQLLQQSALGMDKFIELNKPTVTTFDLGGRQVAIARPGMEEGVMSFTKEPVSPEVEAQKARIAKAGAPSITVSTEKKYGEQFAGKIATEDADLRSSAMKAPEAVATADRIIDLIDTGKVITGTGANARLQIAKALNLAGGNDAERISNTELLVSSLAQQTLGGIKTSNLGAGQGFTNADRDFLEKATAGQINYDAKSLKRLAELARKVSELSAEKWNKRVKEIPADALAGTGISTEPIVIPKRGKPANVNVGNIPAAAVQALRSGQGTAEQFDAVFGAGSAERVLKGE